MRLRIGSATRPNNEAVTSISYSPMFDQARVLIGVYERWDTSGRLVLQGAAGQTEMTVALTQLLADMQQTNVDLVYMEDTANTDTALKLLASSCLKGPYIIDSGLPNRADDVYATGMGYRVIWEALKPFGTSGNAVLEFEEVITTDPGGEQRVMVGGTVNYPERQIGFQHKPYAYTQSGRTVGMYDYVYPPPPLWPWALVCDEPKITLVGPRSIGLVDTEFALNYEYRYEWPEPLYGRPHRTA